MKKSYIVHKEMIRYLNKMSDKMKAKTFSKI